MSSPSATTVDVGAFGSASIFSTTGSTTTASLDSYGAYWYRYPSYSFGFSSSSDITLNSCDVKSNNCANRLCWHLDQNFGGYRAGCSTGLNGDIYHYKLIFKGSTAPSLIPTASPSRPTAYPTLAPSRPTVVPTLAPSRPTSVPQTGTTIIYLTTEFNCKMIFQDVINVIVLLA